MVGIKNIIFDFGGVIYDINFQNAKEAFNEIGVQDFDKLYSHTYQHQLFERLELDLISPTEFRNEIRGVTGISLADEKIDYAWNALLEGFVTERLDLLMSLKKHYQIYLLSNTNRIHYNYFLKQFQELTNYKSFDGLFSKSFFSFDIKRRKPYLHTYSYVLNNLGINAENTLFIDDSIQNIRPAVELGIKGWHLQEDMCNLFEGNYLKQNIIDRLINSHSNL